MIRVIRGDAWTTLVLVLAVLTLAGCGRAPVPTSAQATATALPVASPTYAFPPRTAVPTTTPDQTVTPSSTPGPTVTPTFMPTSTLAPALSPVAYDRNPRAVLIQADMLGASVPREAHVPTWRLYADGLVVAAAGQAPLSSGLDAVVQSGHLSEAEIQSLLAYLQSTGFFGLDASYAPRPTPPNLPTARITVYLTKTKTVSVYGPGHPGTPPGFMDAFTRLTQTVPADAKPFAPAEGYLVATPAGSANDLKSGGDLTEWTPNAGVRLADTVDGVTVSGSAFKNVAALVGKALPKTLFREGSSAYRVRFVPALPRSVYLSDWIGPILDGTREFEARIFDLVGYFRGANLFGEARGTPRTKQDWVILDASGAMWVSGALPPGLDPNSRADAWSVVRLRAAVIYVRNGTSYLEVRRVDTMTSSAIPTPAVSASPMPINTPTGAPPMNSDAAIRSAQARFPELSKIKPASAKSIGASTDIKVFERADGWDLVFWQGSGDCPAGCIDNTYTYISVKKDGRVERVGAYQRSFDAATNSFQTEGTPMWGVPGN